jgi:hypothetical protein
VGSGMHEGPKPRRVSARLASFFISPAFRAETWEDEPSVDAGQNNIWAVALVIAACVLLVASAISGASWPLIGAVIAAAVGGLVAGLST